MASLVPFNIDLTTHEDSRLAAVLDAFGSGWDPTEIFTGEAEARRTLYAHLDPSRVWLPCSHCGDNTALYLLGSDVNLVWVQCGKCLCRWWHDTGVDRGRCPVYLYDVA